MASDRKTIYLPLTPTEGGPTHVGVSVSYWKDARVRGVYATATPVERKADGVDIWEVTSGKSVLVAELARANAKKFEEAAANVKSQTESKSGPVWDAVQQVLAKENLTLAA